MSKKVVIWEIAATPRSEPGSVSQTFSHNALTLHPELAPMTRRGQVVPPVHPEWLGSESTKHMDLFWAATAWNLTVPEESPQPIAMRFLWKTLKHPEGSCRILYSALRTERPLEADCIQRGPSERRTRWPNEGYAERIG